MFGQDFPGLPPPLPQVGQRWIRRPLILIAMHSPNARRGGLSPSSSEATPNTIHAIFVTPRAPVTGSESCPGSSLTTDASFSSRRSTALNSRTSSHERAGVTVLDCFRFPVRAFFQLISITVAQIGSLFPRRGQYRSSCIGIRDEQAFAEAGARRNLIRELNSVE